MGAWVRGLRRATLTSTLAATFLCGFVAAGSTGSPSNAADRAIVAFVGDSNFSFGAGPIVDYLTYGTSNTVYPGNHLNNNYVPVFVARGGAGIRESDCRASTCPTANFWRLKLAAVLKHVQPDALVVDLGINEDRKSTRLNSS